MNHLYFVIAFSPILFIGVLFLWAGANCKKKSKRRSPEAIFNAEFRLMKDGNGFYTLEFKTKYDKDFRTVPEVYSDGSLSYITGGLFKDAKRALEIKESLLKWAEKELNKTKLEQVPLDLGYLEKLEKLESESKIQ